MKKWIAILLALTLVLTLGACAGKAEPAKTPATDADAQTDVKDDAAATELYIPMVALGYSHQFWQAVRQGAEDAAAEYGATISFEGPQDETMVDAQVSMLETALAKNPAAICLAAIDNESVAASLTAAKEKGIRVVGFDAGCGDLAEATCATNSFAAGELAAENAIRLMGETGKIGIVGHSQTTVDAVARVEGFVDYIQKNSKIEIVDTQYGNGDQMKSADIVKSMLTANADIALVYATNEGACVGVYNGVKELNMAGKVLIVGFDSSAALKDGVRSGEIAGAITQDPVGMGYKTVEAAVKLINGEEVEERIDTGCYWYDASNMDDEKISVLLYD